ncbi:hypothetical protein GDO81_005419 [Engystomops pustulosus]|uniref:Uncharacterized protein n=1 Tax=Engystomops pustulosus TaxID=76066 RepID=A0AAV7CPM4_ENGPU|nr:hypothetical protein GDO81_005419 [Engystomops pustulosus]
MPSQALLEEHRPAPIVTTVPTSPPGAVLTYCLLTSLHTTLTPTIKNPQKRIFPQKTFIGISKVCFRSFMAGQKSFLTGNLP